MKTNNQVPNEGETSDAELTCISCSVSTEEVIAGEEYHCWLESRHGEQEAIFDLSTADDSKRFLIPKGEMLCEKEGKSRLYPSGKEIQPLNE